MGCASSAAAGGSCKSGAISGGVSAFANPMLPGDGTGFNGGRLAGSAIIGAVASRLSGGKGENGALTAAFSYLFYEAAEAMKAEEPLPPGVDPSWFGDPNNHAYALRTAICVMSDSTACSVDTLKPVLARWSAPHVGSTSDGEVKK